MRRHRWLALAWLGVAVLGLLSNDPVYVMGAIILASLHTRWDEKGGDA